MILSTLQMLRTQYRAMFFGFFLILGTFLASNGVNAEVLQDKDILDHNIGLDYTSTVVYEDEEDDIGTTKIIYSKVGNQYETNAINHNTVQIDNNTKRIYADGTFYQIGDRFYIVEYEYIEPQLFYDDLQEKYFPLEPFSVGRTLKTLFMPVYALAQSYYPSAGDGIVERLAESTWSSARDVDDGEGADYTTAEDYFKVEYQDSTPKYNVGRAFFPFDTSGLDDDICIASSSFHIKAGSDEGALGTPINQIVETSQVSPDTLAIGDFDAMTIDSPDEGCVSDFQMGTGEWGVCLLNSTGESWINLTGYTYLGMRSVADIDDIPPSVGRTFITLLMSETAGTDSDPFLEIETETCGSGTSTPPAAGTSTPYVVGIPDNMPWTNELTLITGLALTVDDTGTTTTFYYFHIPFIAWIILTVITLWITTRLILEFIIRWRN